MLASEVIDRTFSAWLYPAGINRPGFDILAVGVNSSTLDIVTKGRQRDVPRDTLLEIDNEVIATEDVQGVNVTAAERGYLDTDPAEHFAGAQIRINPEFFRVSVFNALKLIIGLLYPWGIYDREVDASQVFTTTALVPLPALAKRVVSVRVERRGGRFGPPLVKGWDYDVLRDVDAAGTPQLQLYRGGAGGQAMRVVYAKDFAKPATFATNLTTTCGLSEEIQEGLPMAVAGQLLQGHEAPRLDLETIRGLLASAGAQIPVGATYQVGQTLIQAFKATYVSAERDRLNDMDPIDYEYAL